MKKIIGTRRKKIDLKVSGYYSVIKGDKLSTMKESMKELNNLVFSERPSEFV